jgi:alpha-beta hydrolase superfamily lysophospholipase
VVHGLDASKSVTNILSSALADAGFEVFSIDLPGHGDSSVPFTAFSARAAVEQVLNVLGLKQSRWAIPSVGRCF